MKRPPGNRNRPRGTRGPSPRAIFRCIEAAACLEWLGFPADWQNYRISGQVSDRRGKRFLAQLDWMPGRPCLLQLRIDIKGPFRCSAEVFNHLLTQANTVTPAGYLVPNDRDAGAVQATARHAPVTTGISDIVSATFRDLRHVLNCHGVQALLAIADSQSNGADIKPWDEM